MRESAVVVPIREARHVPPTMGRIRVGKKGTSRSGKQIPTSINTFRLTSPDREAIEQAAGLYGGRVEEWHDAKANPPEQWQVITETDRLPILALPGGVDEAYERWGGSGRERFCDGIDCEIYAEDGMETVDCLCERDGALSCKRTVRLKVVLQGVKFGGAWDFVTASAIAAAELPGMADLLAALATKTNGLVAGELVLTRMQTRGGRQKFPVVRISVDATSNELMAGGGTLPVLANPQRNELPSGSSGDVVELRPGDMGAPSVAGAAGGAPTPDDEPVDAVIVEDGPRTWTSRDDIPTGVRVKKTRGVDEWVEVPEGVSS